VTVIKISILTTGRLARKTGQAAHSDTDNAMLVFGHATLVARALQRLPGGAAGCGGMRRNSGIVFLGGVRPSTGRAVTKSKQNNRFGVALAAGDCQSGWFTAQRETRYLRCGSAAPAATRIALRFDICQRWNYH